MASTTCSEILHDFTPLIRVYKDGTIERLVGTATVPPSLDPLTGVQSKDLLISPEIGLGARIYIPKSTTSSSSGHKLPLLVYFHGGGFAVESASSPTYHNYLNALVAEANVVALSVDYRLAPEHPVPTAHDDSWVALKWVASHSPGDGPEAWLNQYADFRRIFLAGDSAGANIAHNMAIRVGSEKLDGLNLVGIALIHSYFWGKDPIGAEASNAQMKREYIDRFWMFTSPDSVGSDDPMFNPVLNPDLPSLGCKRVLIYVAEKDILRDRGWYYYEALKKSGWGGVVEIVEDEGEDHVFHLLNPTSDKALAMLKGVASFMNHA